MAECISKNQWENYLNQLSKVFKDTPVEVEVAASGIFDKPEVEWLPILGISYDPKDNIVSILFENLDHIIEKPYEIKVEKDDSGIKEIDIVSEEDGTKTVLRFKTPVRL